MPVYKAKCSCGAVWSVKKTIKLDDAQKDQLRHRSLCKSCGDTYRRRFLSVQTGIATLDSQERSEVDKLVAQLRENRPHGFTQQPIRDQFEARLEEDRKTIAEGIRTRYRGFSPTREMLKYRYRVLLSDLAIVEAANPIR
jgi:hypothetical protein